MPRQNGLQARHKITLLQLPCAHIDAHRNAQASRVPGLHLDQRGVQHPFAHFFGQRVVFNHRQKHRRGQQTLLRMLPADQGLGTDHRAGAHVDFGLVMQQQFAMGHGVVNACQAFMVAAHTAVLFGIKHAVAVFAGQLGLVHGLVGLALQLVSIDLVGLRVKRDPQAGRDLQGMAVQQQWLMGSGQQAVQQRGTRCGVRQVDQHRHKFVTTNARQRVAFTQDLFHACGHRHQQLVTGVMGVAVVDLLEAVEVEVGHRQKLCMALHVVHGLVQPVCQQHPVRQVGERVKVRQVLQLLFVFLEGSDVSEE